MAAAFACFAMFAVRSFCKLQGALYKGQTVDDLPMPGVSRAADTHNGEARLAVWNLLPCFDPTRFNVIRGACHQLKVLLAMP